MVREIITLSLGNTGNAIGNEFWEMMVKEHKISYDGSYIDDSKEQETPIELKKVHVYYGQSKESMKYMPRACLIDLDPATIDSIKASPLGTLYNADNLCSGKGGLAGVEAWAHGHYEEGAEIIDAIVDMLRKESEKCDCSQGFQVTHSIASGTGNLYLYPIIFNILYFVYLQVVDWVVCYYRN